MGVFRAVDRPVYDELMAEQIGVAKAKGEGELAALLGTRRHLVDLERLERRELTRLALRPVHR